MEALFYKYIYKKLDIMENIQLLLLPSCIKAR